MNFSIDSGFVLWFILGVLGALALAVWVYRFAIPPISSQTRIMLWTLRAFAVTLLLLLLARPLLSLAERGQAQEVVLLEDVSLSMALAGGEGDESRAELAQDALAELEDRLGGRYVIRKWVFASDAREAKGDSVPSLDRAATALGDAVHSLASLRSLAAVVTVTDGVANRGRDPVQASRELGVAVSSVVLGSARDWDASLEEVAVNPTARAGQSTPMEVRLSHSGDTPRRGTLRVTDGTGTLAEKEVVLPPGGTEIIERLSFVPRSVGLSYYRVSLEAGPEESHDQNNLRAVVQQVLPDRQKVLVLTSSLQWDWTWMKRVLEADSAWAVEYVIAHNGRLRRPPGPGGGGDISISALNRYSVVIGQGLKPKGLPAGLGDQLARYVRAGGGLLLWGGPGGLDSDLGSWLNTPLGQALGFDIGDTGVPPSVIPELPDDERVHDIVRLDEDLELNRRYFESLPPLANVTPLAARPGDRVLVSGFGGKTFLLALRRAGRGQALLINGSGLWRWGFSGSDRGATDRFRRFWSLAMRALAEPTQTEPLRVTTDRPLLARGEDVGVTASLQDESFQPVTGAEVEARWIPIGSLDGGELPKVDSGHTTLIDQGDGSYAGNRPSLPPGRYRVEAIARRDGQTQATATAEFVVDTWSPEVQAVQPDRATLEGMARASGGTVVGADDIEKLVRELETRATSTANWQEFRLWENPWLYLVLLGFLSSEWWLRRRRGLP